MKPFNSCLTSGLLLFIQSPPSGTPPDIRGAVTNIQRLQDGNSAGVLAYVLVEGRGTHDKARLRITETTQIFRRPVSGEDVKARIGDLLRRERVEAWFVGPVMSLTPYWQPPARS